MFKFTVGQLARYDKMIPKADYSNLEKFLRTVQDEQLNLLNNAAINTRQGAALPHEQLFLMIVLANIFVNEYDQNEFTKSDYLKLFSIFSVSVFYEVACRNKGIQSRIGEWRELKPTQVEKYRIYENDNN